MTESLFEALSGRQLPTTKQRIPRDPVAYAALVEDLAAALRSVNDAGRASQEDAARVVAAQDALAAAPAIEVEIRALPPELWEELIGQHPPTDEQRERGEEWNPRTLRDPLLAVSVVPPDGQAALSAEQWATLARTGGLGVGELETLYLTAVTINKRVLRMAPGKG